MEKNKTGKYLKYAIGEIVLVVIGILIALSINNWNEERKLRVQELVLLKSIQSDLQICQNEYELAMNSFQNYAIDKRKILKFIDDDLEYSTELDSAFSNFEFWFQPFFLSGTYEIIKTKGADLIQNIDIRNGIIDAFENNLNVMNEDIYKYLWMYTQSVSLPLLNKTIRKNLSSSLAQPIDFEKLKTNDEFKNMVLWYIRFYERLLPLLNRYSTQLKSLIQDIEDELTSRK